MSFPGSTALVRSSNDARVMEELVRTVTFGGMASYITACPILTMRLCAPEAGAEGLVLPKVHSVAGEGRLLPAQARSRHLLLDALLGQIPAAVGASGRHREQ